MTIDAPKKQGQAPYACISKSVRNRIILHAKGVASQVIVAPMLRPGWILLKKQLLHSFIESSDDHITSLLIPRTDEV